LRIFFSADLRDEIEALIESLSAQFSIRRL
jgi:hypothetical protein